MFKLSLKNILKAGISSLCGGLILGATPIIDLLSTGKVDWTHIKGALILAGVLALTDIFKEVKREIDADTDEKK